MHPTSVKVVGIGVKGLMRTFGIELENLVHVKQGRGVEIADNDFLLAPAGLLPPPRIEGRVTAVRLEGGKIEQTFGASTRRGRSQPLHPSDPFDFYLAHLNEQLVAGQSRNQADFGLLTVMPDYADIERRTSAGAKAR